MSIETTLESGQECLKILQQVAAVSGAVNGVMSELLGGNIRERLMDEKASEQESKEDLDEIVAVNSPASGRARSPLFMPSDISSVARNAASLGSAV